MQKEVEPSSSANSVSVGELLRTIKSGHRLFTIVSLIGVFSVSRDVFDYEVDFIDRLKLLNLSVDMFIDYFYFIPLGVLLFAAYLSAHERHLQKYISFDLQSVRTFPWLLVYPGRQAAVYTITTILVLPGVLLLYSWASAGFPYAELVLYFFEKEPHDFPLWNIVLGCFAYTLYTALVVLAALVLVKLTREVRRLRKLLAGASG